MRLRNKPHKCAELTRSASSLLLCSLDRLGFGLNPQGGGNGGWQPPVSSSGLPQHTLTQYFRTPATLPDFRPWLL